MNRNWMAAAALGLCVAVPSLAAEAPAGPKSPGATREASRLAAEFKVSERQVLDLRGRGLGWGEIRHALAISQKAGVPVDDVLKLRQSGMGWGKIARKYGFTLGAATGKPREAAREREPEGRGMGRGHERGPAGRR